MLVAQEGIQEMSAKIHDGVICVHAAVKQSVKSVCGFLATGQV